MKAYWYDNVEGVDQRDPHYSGQDISVEDLKNIGVIYSHVSDPSDIESIASERNYKNRDIINVSPDAMGGTYQAKIQMFFAEHLHEDEEIRYIRDGAGFFDVRSESDKWIRIQLEKDDLIILPAGIYHRFTTDTADYIVAMRLFKEDPKWTPLSRGPVVDKNPYRKEYLESLGTAHISLLNAAS